MSSEHWQNAKQALAAAMALEGEARLAFLSNLKQSNPQLHDEVSSLLIAQNQAEQVGFLSTAAAQEFDTLDQYGTLAHDPSQTRAPNATDDTLGGNRPAAPSDSLVGDEYELEKKIGQGGMGVVYKAYHRSLRRTVALKIITAGGLRDEIDIARFHIEAEAAARLDHPGIVPVYDVGQHNDNHFYAMAYVEGPSLSEFVGANAKLLPPRRAAAIMEQVSRAVQYAHDRAVIHRDLKPANIILEGGEVPRLTDFGLAKNMHEEDGLTMTGQVMGTPSYMAPEQASGKLGEISNRTDVYSLGATLYALLAGRPPFAGGTLLETIRQVVRSNPDPLTQIVQTVPQDLETICEKCLAKRPEERYNSAEDVADDLRRYLDGFPISARRVSLAGRLIRWCRRNPLESALLGTTAVAILVGAVVSVIFGIEANRQAAAAKVALAEAEANAQDLREAIEEAFVFASESELAKEPGMQTARAVLLETAERYYSELARQSPTDAISKAALADAQFNLSKVQMALGNDETAEESLRSALTIQESLVERGEPTPELLAALAKTYNQLQRLSKQRWQELTQLSVMGKLPDDKAEMATRYLNEWQRQAAEVVELRRQVVAAMPEDLESLRLLASALMNQGVGIGEQGYAQRDLALLDRARQIMLDAQAVRLEALEKYPEESPLRRDLGLGFFNMANTELGAADCELTSEPYFARLRTAVDDLSAAIEAYSQLPSSELVLDTQLALATCLRLRADARFRLQETEPADQDYLQAVRQLELLTTRSPHVSRYRNVLAEAQYNRCQLLFFQGREEQALEQFDRCVATLLQALRIDPNNHTSLSQLLPYVQNLVEPLIEANHQQQAKQLIDQVVLALQALRDESPEFEAVGATLESLESLKNKVESVEVQQLPTDQEI